MAEIGSESNPLRVAIVGSGPAGFYVVAHLTKQTDIAVEMDMFDRLPTPFGLVRAGVAPDHQKYKRVTQVYDRSAQSKNYRFFGNVTFGEHLTLEDLENHYHQIVFATGAQSDKNLNIFGEDLEGSYAATNFVAWYNGHPDYKDLHFDLSKEKVAIIGLGNVAIDIARILCKSHDELRRTDMADHALDALSRSNVKEVTIVGRRGPAQAAFTFPEVRELKDLSEADIFVRDDEIELDELTREFLAANPDKNAEKNIELMHEYAAREPEGRPKKLTLRFLVSPSELLSEDGTHISALKMTRNELMMGEDGGLRAASTDEEEIIPVDLVFRSIGYHGIPLPDVPYNERSGTIENQAGRVADLDGGEHLTGLYTAGWAKRGPTGVIGTNKTDAQETVACMVEDLEAGKLLDPANKEPGDILGLVRERQPDYFTYGDWVELDAEEQRRGEEADRPRVKFTDVGTMLEQRSEG